MTDCRNTIQPISFGGLVEPIVFAFYNDLAGGADPLSFAEFRQPRHFQQADRGYNAFQLPTVPKSVTGD